ncbi:peptide chain release factor 1 n [Acanthamoeba polyphaga mimivirus]|uniref:Peptide chain release factor 1 n n=1 Tax=Acanthamoeba polyphaga mimivirus TaxID=212035 RepID=A0A0G2Y695_MIMIV|nr:peptide chain release factor 1 n [Acanthamoeba polyphaga mimivirus]
MQTINYQLKTIKNIPETGLVVCAGNYTIKKTHTTNSREILSCL